MFNLATSREIGIFLSFDGGCCERLERHSKSALYFFMLPFVSSPLIKLKMTALAKFSLELGSSECSKIGGRADIPTNDPRHLTLHSG